MAQLVTIFLLVVVSIFIYRRFLRAVEKLLTETRQRKKERETGATGTLVKDPETGEYRVKRYDDV